MEAAGVVAAVGVSSTGRQRREWHRRAGCGGAAAVWQQQCGRGGSVAAAAVWRRRPGGIGVTVSAWRCGSSGRAAVVWHHQRTSSRGGPMWRERCGSSGVAAAADGSSWAEPAGDDQSGGRACVRAGAQTWLAHLRGRQRGRGERASGRWRAFFEFTEYPAGPQGRRRRHPSSSCAKARRGRPEAYPKGRPYCQKSDPATPEIGRGSKRALTHRAGKTKVYNRGHVTRQRESPRDVRDPPALLRGGLKRALTPG